MVRWPLASGDAAKWWMYALVVAIVIAGLTAGLSYWEVERVKKEQAEETARLKQTISRLEEAFGERLGQAEQRFGERAEELKSEQRGLAQTLLETRSQLQESLEGVHSTLAETEQQRQSEILSLKDELLNIQVATGDFSTIAQELLPKIVSITTNNSKGTGAIIDEEGYIVTNFHVVEFKEFVNVALSNAKTYKAELVGFDQDYDIALLRIDKRKLSYFEWGDSDALKVGEKVLALGNPVGLEFTATQGIVSAKNRRITGLEGTFIQTDVPINPGNSGGPLVNSKGQLIGINTLKVAGHEGLGFARPSNEVIGIATVLKIKYLKEQSGG